MKKMICIFALILSFCVCAYATDCVITVTVDTDFESGQVIVSGVAEKNSVVPIILLEIGTENECPGGTADGLSISPENISDYARHIVYVYSDDMGKFEKTLPMVPSDAGKWYTLLSENSSFKDFNEGIKIYYPSENEFNIAKAAMNSANTDSELQKALELYARVLGVSLNSDAYKMNSRAFCKMLFEKKPNNGWEYFTKENENTSFKNDFFQTEKFFERNVEALAKINTATRSSLTDIIREYNDILKLDIDGKYKTVGESNINRLLVGKNFKNLDQFVSAFNSAVENYTILAPKISGGGGGGGAGSITIEKENSSMPEHISDIQTDITFVDLDTVQWAKQSIMYLAKRNVVSGTGNGMFSPELFVTREQFVKMLLLSLEFPINNENGEIVFSDASVDDWFYPYVITANQFDIVKGKEDGTFGTGELITREDMATLVYRAAKKVGVSLPNTVSVMYTDENDISDYAREAINCLGGAEVIYGLPNGSFDPQNFSTRAQAAVILERLLKNIKE